MGGAIPEKKRIAEQSTMQVLLCKSLTLVVADVVEKFSSYDCFTRGHHNPGPLGS